MNSEPIDVQPFLRSAWRTAFARLDVLAVSFGLNLLTLALPLVILQIYDRIIPESSMDTFGLLMLGIGVVMIIDLLLRLVRNYIVNWSAARFEHGAGRRAVDRLLMSDINAFERSPASVHLDRLAAIEAVRDFHSGGGLITFSELPFAILFIGLIALIGGNLALAPLAVAAIAFAFAVVLGMKLDHAIRQRAFLDDQRYSFLFHVLSGIHAVKGLGLEAQFIRNYQAILAPLAQAVERVAYLSSIGQALTLTFSNIAMVGTAIIGAVLVVDGDLTSGALVASILLAGRAIQPIMRMIGLWVQSRNLKLARERLNDLMDLTQENDRLESGPNKISKVAPIELDNVTVHRGFPEFPSLSNVSLTLQEGSLTALTGPEGGGKLTLLDLLAGFLPADEGKITFSRLDGKYVDFIASRASIGYVRQEALLAKGTIRDNLSQYGDRKTLALALSYAADLGLDKVLAHLPQGLETRVGDTASDTLAGSVRQQISLVRALARKPKLLLLDDANSAFDLATDQRFQKLLVALKGDCTIVLTTSRPSILRLADTILKVDKGIVKAVPLESVIKRPTLSSAKTKLVTGSD